ncbi:Zinc finger protein 26 [Nymphon striatum]|nr:Zinc finger protein 26 [Nymphon striatum]
MDLVKWSRTTIKKEPEFDIEQNNSVIDSPPFWHSVEIKNIKDENEDSLSSVYDDNAEYLQEKNCKEQYEVLNQETSKNMMNSAFSKTIGANIHDRSENSQKIKGTIKSDDNEVTERKAYECNVCHKCFTNRCNLKYHMRIHTNEKPFECDMCHKSFTHKSHLKSHTSTHTNEHPFECEVCSKRFTRKDNLKAHKRIHTNEKPFECEMDLVKWSRTTIKKEPEFDIEQNNSIIDSPPFWHSVEIKNIKDENEDSLSSVYDDNAEYLQEKNCKEQYEDLNQETSKNIMNSALSKTIDANLDDRSENSQKIKGIIKTDENEVTEMKAYECNMDPVKWRRTTIKKEPGFDIEQNNSIIDSPPLGWLSVEVNNIKEENEDTPSSVYDDNADYLQEEKCNVKYEVLNQETSKNNMNSTFSKTFITNMDARNENIPKTIRSLKTNENEVTEIKAYECNVCHKCFPYRGSLKYHMRIHTSEKPFECDVCHKSFTTSTLKMDLVKWSRTTIKKEPEFDIEQNNSIIDSPPPGWLSVEIKNIKEENEDSLSSVYDVNADYLHEKKCKKQYEVLNRETSKNIMNSTFSKTFDPNMNDRNENSPKTICSLEMDENEVTDTKAYECNVCHKCFPKKDSLKRHMRHMHTNEKPFKCDICHKSFIYKSHLKSHTSTHTNEHPFECEVCCKCFTRKENLKAHKRIHTNVKPFECKVCHRCFTEKGNLKDHIRIHTNEKPFECDICHEFFSRRASLKYHMCIHTNEKPFECNVCHKICSQSSHLREHMRTHTNRKPFVCNVCHKCFNYSSSLRRHLHTHGIGNKKSFACDICDKSFTYSDRLKRHKRMHSDEKSFKCDVCSKGFKESSNLKRHLLKHFES